MSVTLVLGGARSGKSRFAESLARGECHYIATAEAHDDEMQERIDLHKTRRGSSWTTHEETREIAALITSLSRPQRFVLVDCLTLWLSNLLMAEEDWERAAQELCTVLQAQRSDVVLVSNEVGLGIVPVMPLGRVFRDAQGILNQQVAAISDTVVFVAAGLPLALKGQVPQRP